MSFARTIQRTPGVFYQDISGTTLAMRGLGLGIVGGPNANPTPFDQTNYPFGKYSAQTLQLQNALNVLLIKNGYCPIIADGQLGPATCGAGSQLFTDAVSNPGNPSLMTDFMTIPTMAASPSAFMPSTCGDELYPKKVSDGCGTGPMPPTLTPAQQAAQQAALTSSSGFSLTSGKTLAVGAGVIALIGLGYYALRAKR
jgi:hypothetical protein